MFGSESLYHTLSTAIIVFSFDSFHCLDKNIGSTVYMTFQRLDLSPSSGRRKRYL